MEMVNGVLAGVGAGLGANYGQKQLDQAQRKPDFFNEVAWFERWEETHSVLHRIEAHLKTIADAAKPDEAKTQLLVLQPGVTIPYQTYGKQYTLMFIANATQVLFRVPGIGNMLLNLNAGWNIINLPDGTEVGLPLSAPTSVNVLYRASNVLYGSAI